MNCEIDLAVVERDVPEFVSNLTKSAGTRIGLELQEFGLIINATNDKAVKAGMVFNMSLGSHNLQAETAAEKSRNFSFLLVDTIIVTNEGHEVVTQLSTKALRM
ncbi:hypothetical protein FXO37_23930 [Capsicum annuum]|nr:hypothetical protein FXO37_23930 [Capsicum annuum]